MNTKELYEIFYNLGIDFYTGVPDKKLAGFLESANESQSTLFFSKDKQNTFRKNNIQVVPAACEANAVSIATGYHIATGNCPVVYMSNTGFWSSIGSLFHLADSDAFSIPMLIIVVLDKEEQSAYNKKNALLTKTVIEDACYPYQHLTVASDFKAEITHALEMANEFKKPCFILIDEDALQNDFKYVDKKFSSLSKQDAIKYITSVLSDTDFVVASAGNVSHEIYAARDMNKQSHNNDLLVNGAFGQASSVAYGIALNTNKNVYCIDGDGAFLRDLGGLTTAVQNTQRNLKYILIDDGSYSTAGGTKTPIQCLDTKKMLKSMGMKNTIEAYSLEDVKVGMLRLAKEKSVLIVKVYDNKHFSKDFYMHPTTNAHNFAQALQNT